MVQQDLIGTPTKPFFDALNLKKGFAKKRFCCWVKRRTLKGSAEIFILFLELWTHLDAFTFLRNLY